MAVWHTKQILAVHHGKYFSHGFLESVTRIICSYLAHFKLPYLITCRVMLMWSIDVIFLWSLRKCCVLGVSLWLLVIHLPGDLIRADKFRFNEQPPPSGGAVVVRFKELWLCQPPDCPRWLSSGLVTNSILFCWLITIKDRCTKVHFQQTRIEGFCQLFLIVSRNLCA